MKKLIIDRDRWMRGKGRISRLLRNDGNRCCLGFLGQACGYSDLMLLGISYPWNTFDSRWPPSLFKQAETPSTHSPSFEESFPSLSMALAYVNDTENDLGEYAREDIIRIRMYDLGYEVTFINGEEP